MEQFSKKEYLRLQMPTEELPVGDRERIGFALESLGYGQVSFPLPVLRKLYPLCRDAGFDITVTLVKRESDWVITDVEAATGMNVTGVHVVVKGIEEETAAEEDNESDE